MIRPEGMFYKQINIQTRRSYYNKADLGEKQNVKQLHPWYVTGFTNGEQSFILSVTSGRVAAGCIHRPPPPPSGGGEETKNKRYKTGWAVKLVFQLALHERDKAILILIQN